MIKKIISVLIVISMAFLPVTFYAENSQVNTVSNSVITSFQDNIQNSTISNELIELTFSLESGEIIVRNKVTGFISASSTHLSVKTYSDKGEMVFNTYNHSFINDGIRVKATNESLVLSYHISDSAKLTKADLPSVITSQRFKQVIENRIDSDDLKTVKRRYEFISKDEATDEQVKAYPALEKDDIYVLRKIEDFVAENLLEIFYKKAGYTASDLEKDNEENNVKTDSANQKLSIDLDVEYKLVEDKLEVNIKTSKVKTSENLSIVEINLMPDFTKANVTDEGYVLFPDGNGAISYHNQKLASKYGRTEIQIYGEDKAIRVDKKFDTYQKSLLPVFGLKVNQTGILGVINRGSEIASIVVDGNDSISTVYTKFLTMPSDNIDLGGGSATTSKVYPKQFYKKDISVYYFFLNDGDNGYVQMANRFRKYLVDTDNMPETGYKSDINIDVIMSIRKDSALLGVIPYKKLITLTSPQDIINISEQLNSEGIKDVTFNLVGWQKNALNSTLTDKGIKSVTKRLASLQESLKKYGYTAFVNTNAINFESAKGISKLNDTVKHIGNNTASYFEFDFVTGCQDTKSSAFYLLDTQKLSEKFKSYIKRISKANVKSLSFSDLSDLNSNFKSNKFYSRTDAMNDIVRQIQSLNENFDLMISETNYPLIKYSDNLYNIPLNSSNLNITSQDVPFFAIVYRGYIPFSGSPINLAGDYKRALLKTAETGAALSFSFCASNSSELIGINNGKYYSASFDDWKQEIINNYKKYNIESNLKIINHYCVENNVFCTEFEDKTKIYTNYNTYDITVNKLTVKSMDFEIERE